MVDSTRPDPWLRRIRLFLGLLLVSWGIALFGDRARFEHIAAADGLPLWVQYAFLSLLVLTAAAATIRLMVRPDAPWIAAQGVAVALIMFCFKGGAAELIAFGAFYFVGSIVLEIVAVRWDRNAQARSTNSS